MKLQCPCGAKYSFEITPEMLNQPVRFVCANCGYDSSEFVNDMIRKKFAEQAPTPAVSSAPAAMPPVAPPVRMRVASAPPAEPVAEAPAESSGKPCPKHPHQIAQEKCVVCGKPICPSCMEILGYVCSPLCKARAASHGIAVPVYAGQRSVVEAKRWRKIAFTGGALGVLLAALLGAWFWYAWFGSRPKPIFSVRFPEKVHSGASSLCTNDQLVFLRGGTLARYDVKTQKEIWSRELVDKAKVEKQVDDELASFSKLKEHADNNGYDFKMPRRDKLLTAALREAAAELQLQVSGQNVWVVSPDRLTHFDWNTGKTQQDLPRAPGFERFSLNGDELVFTGEDETGNPLLTHVNLATGETSKEKINDSVGADAVVAAAAPPQGGLPAGKPSAVGKPLDPTKVAAQAQNLSVPARIALPATLANALHNQQIAAALSDDQKAKLAELLKTQRDDHFQFIPSRNGNVEFSVKLLEEKLVSHVAMKAPPKKSSLNGDLNVTQTADVANEILNEMQRNAGADKVTEDESRYQVTVRLPNSNGVQDWTQEVTGRPHVFVLKSVNVIAANKTLIVLDKSNKKLWQAALTYNVEGRSGSEDEEGSSYGAAPCVERGDTLYVADQAVLTAFDLASGNARWRVPTVGVVGMFFDDKGMLYVNSTTASPDKIRYSRQIDVNDRTSAVILKIDPKAGKTLWSSTEHGFITHVSGKYIYTMDSFDPDDDDEEGNDNDLTAILHRPAFLKIRRINASNGKLMWEHFQQRAPLSIQFDGNSIELVFKKEVQVLRFLSL